MALSLPPRVESHIHDGDGEPTHQPGRAGQVDKVVEDRARARLERRKPEQADEARRDQGNPRHTVLRRLEEDRGCVPGRCQTVERAGRGVHVGVSGGPGGRDEAGVDERGNDFNACTLEGDDEGRAGGRAVAKVESLVVLRDQHAGYQAADD